MLLLEVQGYEYLDKGREVLSGLNVVKGTTVFLTFFPLYLYA